MGTPKQIIRNYSGMPDVEMLEFAQKIHGQFINDKAGFVAYDPDFDDPFESGWQVAIVAAEQIITDEALVDQLQGLTQQVEEKMDDCRHKFQSAKRFIEKAFPDNKPVHNEFGYDNYLSVRKSQTHMIQFMENFHRVAENYKTQLIAQNYTQTHIDEIETLRDELHSANEQQEAFKGGRPVLTQDRIITLNTPWDITADVCRAGKDIFHDNPAKYESYLLPSSESGGGEPQPTGIITAVTDQSTLKQVKLTLQNIATGDFEIVWGDGGKTTITLDDTEEHMTYGYGLEGAYTIEIKGSLETLSHLSLKEARLTSVTVKNLPNLTDLRLNDNMITGAVVENIPEIEESYLQENMLSEEAVNNILIAYNSMETSNGRLYLQDGTNAAPTGDGLAAKANLESRGWHVNTN